VGTVALSPELKGPRLEADHSPATSADVKKTWIYTSTPPYVFMAYKHRDSFILIGLSNMLFTPSWVQHYCAGKETSCHEVLQDNVK
jgi:hypothetical protein